MTEDHFEIDATPEDFDYLWEIAATITSLFSISREEAVGRFNKLWAGRMQLRADSQLPLFFRENTEYWAKQAYYVDGTYWWREGEPIIPRAHP